jgi:quercetin dioxygenase-like cupin family protein
MYIITADSAPRFDIPGVEFTAYAAPSLGCDDLCAWQIKVAPGLISDQAHTLDHDEIFLVTAGTISLSPDSQPLTVGDCAIVPAGSPILLTNLGEDPAMAHVLVKAGFTAKMADGSAVPTPPWAR